MPRNFKLDLKSHTRDPQHVVRASLGVLLFANLIAAWFVFQTPGGTLEQLESELAAQRKQLITRQQAVANLKRTVEQTEKSRAAGDNFLNAYFLPRRHAYSMLEIDLANAARSAGIRARDRSNNYEAIEGSDTLGMLNVNANFEGTYADLIELVNALDRSKRLIIIEQLQATPQQGSTNLAVSLKLNTFFRMEGPQDATETELIPDQPAAPPAAAPKPAPSTARLPGQTVKPPAAGQPGFVQPPPPSQVSEPRSGPPPISPRVRSFNPSRRQPEEKEQ
ncbi:MAG: type 4a pilus biogenesis protein PilO [Acidobacteria bacterium]|nr:type 4a pilus biogenesis protein PilO [Acidobacteriota bacterium]